MKHILLPQINSKISKNGKKYLLINFLSVIIFGILYFLNDYFISNNIELAKKFGFVDKNYKSNSDKSNSDKSNTLLYYIWFSLITQTTLGYSGLLNEKSGLIVPFSKISYRSFKLLNILQISSIFIYASLFI